MRTGAQGSQKVLLEPGVAATPRGSRSQGRQGWGLLAVRRRLGPAPALPVRCGHHCPSVPGASRAPLLGYVGDVAALAWPLGAPGCGLWGCSQGRQALEAQLWHLTSPPSPRLCCSCCSCCPCCPAAGRVSAPRAPWAACQPLWSKLRAFLGPVPGHRPHHTL